MATERRLIDANAVLLAIDIHGTNKFGMLDEDIREFIKKQPTVDAVEVVHGRWIDGMKCSVCGQVDWTKPNYCPNCGADMR